MDIFERSSGPKIWWFHFDAKPSPDGPDHARFHGGHIHVWVAKQDGVFAEKIARDAIAKTAWQVVRLVQQKYGSLELCRGVPHCLEHIKRAIVNGYSVYFFCAGSETRSVKMKMKETTRRRYRLRHRRQAFKSLRRPGPTL